MRDWHWLYEYCLNRFGSVQALETRLPVPASSETLRAIGDDRYLSLLARRVFRAGLKHSVVDAKWPAFEQAFWGFDPDKVVLMGAEHLERLMDNSDLIRHLAKLKSVPRNAQMVLDIAYQYGSFGAWLADWPSTQITGLWRELSRRGSQLGGLSAPSFLRMAGKDTFLLTTDVVAALQAQGVIDGPASSQKTLAAVQEAFNQWQTQSGRPLCQLSALLAYTTNH